MDFLYLFNLLDFDNKGQVMATSDVDLNHARSNYLYLLSKYNQRLLEDGEKIPEFFKTELAKVLEERQDLKYVTDVAAATQAELDEKFGKRVFATPKKMGAETAEANVNAGLAAARQIVAYFADGCTRFQLNK